MQNGTSAEVLKGLYRLFTNDFSHLYLIGSLLLEFVCDEFTKIEIDEENSFRV